MCIYADIVLGDYMRIHNILIQLSLIFLLFFLGQNLFSQETISYSDLLQNGNYDEALKIINDKISLINETRVDNKMVPSTIITVESIDQTVDLKKLFSERKNELYMIENNPELSKLHFDAGICYRNLKIYDSALNNFYQSLRYKEIQSGVDDVTFYEISQIHKENGDYPAYLNTLETAYGFNPSKIEYSAELGRALYSTNQKKKAIYHLNKYVLQNSSSDPNVYLLLGGLSTDIGKYLESAEYYEKYLSLKPDDPYIMFALGFINYQHIGNFNKAIALFSSAVNKLPENEILYKSKCYEYIGDMLFKNLKYTNAITAYSETIKYEESINNNISSKKTELETKNNEIRELKISMLKQNNYLKFAEYQFQSQEKEKILFELKDLNYEFNKINSGKIRWNTAECYERLNMLNEAIEFYKKSISYNYKSNESRSRIIKLQLKIKRGF